MYLLPHKQGHSGSGRAPRAGPEIQLAPPFRQEQAPEMLAATHLFLRGDAMRNNRTSAQNSGGRARPFRWRLGGLAAVGVLLVSLAGRAQAPVGNIGGVVTDPSGAAISGASVTAISLSAGAKRTATTSDEGYFLISTLQPGDYKVTFEYRGFANAVVERVVVEVGQTARVDMKMTLPGAAEQVVVQSEATGVETTQSTVGGVVNTRQIEQLPLNGRNYLELAKLEPGVEIQEGRSFDP